MEQKKVAVDATNNKGFVTKVVSVPGAAMKVTVIEAPEHVRKSISDGLERGPDAAMKEDNCNAVTCP